jgi:hypothetical protein
MLVAFILAAFALPFMSVFRGNAPSAGLWILGGVLFFVAFLLTGMRYIISGGKLRFRIWFIRGWSVDIADIRSVKRSYNLLSSPAASLKRLRVSFWPGTKAHPFMLISPARERRFIDELRAINPDIDVAILERKGLWRVWDWDI